MAARFWVGGTGTWDNADTTHWSTSSGGAGGASVPASTDSVTFDGSSGGGTVTVAATINASNTLVSLSCGAFTGTLTFAVNNPSITYGSFSCTGSATKTLNAGSGTHTITNPNGTVIDIGGTGTTFNAGAGTFLLSAVPTNSRLVSGSNGIAFNNLTVTNASYSGYAIDFSGGGAFTVANLTLTKVGALYLPGATTITVNSSMAFDGASANSPSIIASRNTTATLSVGAAVVLNNVLVQNITKAGAGSITANSSYDGGSNSGVTINSPPVSVIGG